MRGYQVLAMGEDVGSGALTDLNVYAYTTIVDYVGTTNQATASISLNSDGTITLSAFGNGSAWHNVPTAGVGSSFWAIVALTSGSLTTGTTGSRVSLATGATWNVATTGSGSLRTKNALGTIQIWDAASAGTMVSSGEFKLEATMQATASSGGGGGGDDPGDPFLGQPLQKY